MSDDRKEPILGIDLDEELEDGVATIGREDEEIKEPKLYKVVFLNDDYTPIEWVVDILMTYFGKSIEKATLIAQAVHLMGKGIAGVYPQDIAETKSYQVNNLAAREEYPFQSTVEPE